MSVNQHELQGKGQDLREKICFTEITLSFDQPLEKNAIIHYSTLADGFFWNWHLYSKALRYVKSIKAFISSWKVY